MECGCLMGEGAHKVKVIVVGDTSVGKSNLINKFCRGLFDINENSTIGIQYAFRNFQTDINNQRHSFSLCLWDIKGQIDIVSDTPTFFKNALGVIYMYDIARQSTFHHLEDWKKIVKERVSLKIVQEIVIGNKKDLQQLRDVKFQIAKNWAQQRKIPLYQVSVLQFNHIQIQIALKQLLKKIVTVMELKRDKLNLQLNSQIKYHNIHRICQ